MRPINLRITAVGTSCDLFKMLYLELESNSRVERLSRFLRSSPTSSPDYALKPHLSLLYKQLPGPTRAVLARRLDVGGESILFGQIAAVRPGDGRDDWLEIEHWDVWLRKDLGREPPPVVWRPCSWSVRLGRFAVSWRRSRAVVRQNFVRPAASSGHNRRS